MTYKEIQQLLEEAIQSANNTFQHINILNETNPVVIAGHVNTEWITSNMYRESIEIRLNNKTILYNQTYLTHDQFHDEKVREEQLNWFYTKIINEVIFHGIMNAYNSLPKPNPEIF